MNHNRDLQFLILFLITFCIIFFIAYLDFQRDIAQFGFLPPKLVDGFIMAFSIIVILKVLLHILKW